MQKKPLVAHFEAHLFIGYSLLLETRDTLPTFHEPPGPSMVRL